MLSIPYSNFFFFSKRSFIYYTYTLELMKSETLWLFYSYLWNIVLVIDNLDHLIT